MGADAKIDLEKVMFMNLLISPLLTHLFFCQNVIKIHRPPLPIYQSIIEKTHGLAFHTQVIDAAMARPPQGQPQGESETKATAWVPAAA